MVRKLRNHPSLALWAGNNEIDECLRGWFGASIDPNTDRLSRAGAAGGPAAARSRCAPYLPSSPYHSPAWFAAGNQTRLMPEDHLWGPRDYYKGQFYTASAGAFRQRDRLPRLPRPPQPGADYGAGHRLALAGQRAVADARRRAAP